MLSFAILVVAVAITLFLILSKRCASSEKWQATLTPLASIMGSGFLVSAPLLAGIVGNYALLSMAALLLLAYSVGSALRFNILYFEPIENQNGPSQKIALLSRIVLSGAYFISITYYLQLLAAFVLNIGGIHNETYAHMITSSLLIMIGFVGLWRGLSSLEKLEKYAVSFNLGMIGALLLALLVYNLQHIYAGQWKLPPLSPPLDLHNIRVLIGLLIVVQGFETSRYLGSIHSASIRIQTMRNSQILSSLIYLVFIGLCTFLFHEGLNANVTAIIQMTKPVAVVLPLLLSVAAIGSQFSAAVADAEGAGGLIEDLTQKRLPARYAYILILIVTLSLTWVTHVTEIIAYASRAFALYYALQCLVAVNVALSSQVSKRHLRVIFFSCLSVICFLIAVLGIPAG